jgi:hypothetical protein
MVPAGCWDGASAITPWSPPAPHSLQEECGCQQGERGGAFSCIWTKRPLAIGGSAAQQVPTPPVSGSATALTQRSPVAASTAELQGCGGVGMGYSVQPGVGSMAGTVCGDSQGHALTGQRPRSS